MGAERTRGKAVKRFNPTSPHPDRAVQAWQILVGKATNRQTITYERLAELMYRRHDAGVLNEILGHIAFYCNQHDLPPLTAIVVGKGRGTPGENIPIDQWTVDKRREQVYGYDWYDVYPPSADETSSHFFLI